MIDIQVDIRPLIRRLHLLTYNIEKNIPEATMEALEHIHFKAMENLYTTNLQWGSGYGFGPEEESIRQTVKIDPKEGSLTYTSKHARLIEYGGTYSYNRPKELGPMPIGKQEGHIEGYGYNIIGNIQGKYFLTRAFMSEGNAVRNIYEKYIRMAIRDSE